MSWNGVSSVPPSRASRPPRLARQGAFMHLRSSRIGCAILAAGTSPRVGRRNDLVRPAGPPLIQRVTLAACRSRVARTVVIVGSLPTTSRPRSPTCPSTSSRIRFGPAGWRRRSAAPSVGRAGGTSMVSSWPWPTGWLSPRPTSMRLLPPPMALFRSSGRRTRASPGLPALFPRDCYSRLEQLVGDVDAHTILLTPIPISPSG